MLHEWSFVLRLGSALHSPKSAVIRWFLVAFLDTIVDKAKFTHKVRTPKLPKRL